MNPRLIEVFLGVVDVLFTIEPNIDEGIIHLDARGQGCGTVRINGC